MQNTTPQKKLKITARHILLVFLLLIPGLLITDFLLKQSGGKGLCPTNACAIVGSYVRFGENFLILFGIFFFLILWLIMFFWGRYPKYTWLSKIFSLCLFGALAFDGAILSYQFISLQEECLICISIGISLLIITLLFAKIKKSFILIPICFAIWLGGFAGNVVLKFPESTPSLNATVAFSWSAKNNTDKRDYYFFFSYHCVVCEGVLKVLATHSTLQGNWHFSALGVLASDYKKTAILRNKMLDPNINPFVEILRAKNNNFTNITIGIKTDIAPTANKANVFTQNSFPGHIPVLLTMFDAQPESESYVITHAEGILTFLAAQKSISTTPLRELPADLLENNNHSTLVGKTQNITQ